MACPTGDDAFRDVELGIRDPVPPADATTEPADATTEPADATTEPADATTEPADAVPVTCHAADASTASKGTGNAEASPCDPDPDSDPTEGPADDLDPAEWPSLAEMATARPLPATAVTAVVAHPHPVPMPEPADFIDFTALHGEAVARSAMARSDEHMRVLAEQAATGARIRDEQSHLLARILDAVPHAVREAAARGQRSTSILDFSGSDKFGEFCYLYMLRGAHTGEARREMDAMGVKPALPRLKRLLRPFVVRHVWSRATNDNSVILYW